MAQERERSGAALESELAAHTSTGLALRGGKEPGSQKKEGKRHVP